MDHDLVIAIDAQADGAEKARPQPSDLGVLAAFLNGMFCDTPIEEIERELKQVWSLRQLPMSSGAMATSASVSTKTAMDAGRIVTDRFNSHWLANKPKKDPPPVRMTGPNDNQARV
jgi:hypothetical protein